MAHINKLTPIPVSARVYELDRIPLEDYPNIFGVLLASEDWRRLMDRRNKFARMFTKFRPGTSEANSANKEIVKIDEKAAGAILATLVNYYLQMDAKESKRKVTLKEFKDDFVKTPEQEAIYEDFNNKLDQANFLIDVVDTIVSDAKGLLHQLDPTSMLTEFDSIKQMQRILRDYSYARHNNEHPDIFDLFSEYSDEITDFCYLKSAQYNKEYRALRAQLIAAHEITEDSNQLVQKDY